MGDTDRLKVRSDPKSALLQLPCESVGSRCSHEPEVLRAADTRVREFWICQSDGTERGNMAQVLMLSEYEKALQLKLMLIAA